MEQKEKRYAFEWFVREQDTFYHNMEKRRMKKITALAVTSTVISGIAIAICLYVLLGM